MELAIVELNSKKPTAAGPIATPAPSPAASPAASPAPAPAAPAAAAPAAPPAAAPSASPAAAPSASPAAAPAAAPTASPATAPPASPAAAPTPSPAASPAPPGAPAAPTPTVRSGSGCAHPGQHFSHASDGQSMITQRCSAVMQPTREDEPTHRHETRKPGASRRVALPGAHVFGFSSFLVGRWIVPELPGGVEACDALATRRIWLVDLRKNSGRCGEFVLVWVGIPGRDGSWLLVAWLSWDARLLVPNGFW